MRQICRDEDWCQAGWHLQADQLSWGEQRESSLHHLTKPLAQTIWCEGARGGVSGSYIINRVTSNLHGCHMYLGICGTASKCHADYFAYIMMRDCLVSSCHDDTPDKWGRSIRDWPSVEWQHRDRQIRPSDCDQETRPHKPRVCSHVRCWVISWLSEILLNILYWGILLRMSGVVLKASQYLARLFQWSKWASQMDFQKFYNFHIFSHHRPHIKISKEPSSISWYPLWRW